MYTIIEISRIEPITGLYAPYAPFVVKGKLFYGDTNAEIASWWTGSPFNVSEPIRSRQTVSGVVYNNTINYTRKDSIAECVADEKSYYWDDDNQELYIHLDHNVTMTEDNFAVGIAIGLSTDGVRYVSGKEFLPFVTSFPAISNEVDKFNYSKTNYASGSIVVNNRSGFFNQFKESPIYGNLVEIKTGEDDDEYDDLTLRQSFYVNDYDFGSQELTIDVQDTRSSLTKLIPDKFFNDTDYPDIETKNIGKLVPFAFGPSSPISPTHYFDDVPGFCINGTAISSTVDPIFVFVEGFNTVINVQYLEDDIWKTSTLFTIDYSKFELTIPEAKKVSGTDYGYTKVKCSLIGLSLISEQKTSDVIRDINYWFLDIEYDSSNYNISEWESAKNYMHANGIYLDKQQTIDQVITSLQSTDIAGFKYDTVNGKRTLLLDNPNKDESFVVPYIDVFNLNSLIADSNKDDMYNRIVILYDESIINDTYKREENNDYYDASFAKYNITKEYEIKTKIQSTLVAEKASLLAEDLSEIRLVYELVLVGEKYLDLQIFDILEVELDINKVKFVYHDVWQKVLSTTGANIQKVLSGSPVIQKTFYPIEVVDDTTELFGTVRGQIISVKPDFKMGLTTIQLRERPWSTVWEDIYG